MGGRGSPLQTNRPGFRGAADTPFLKTGKSVPAFMHMTYIVFGYFKYFIIHFNEPRSDLETSREKL